VVSGYSAVVGPHVLTATATNDIDPRRPERRWTLRATDALSPSDEPARPQLAADALVGILLRLRCEQAVVEPDEIERRADPCDAGNQVDPANDDARYNMEKLQEMRK
jgi:hypothetical protein